MKQLPALVFLLLAQSSFSQEAGVPAAPALDPYCAGLAGQIAEAQGVKTRVEQLNERATTSLGVNPQAENFIIPQMMERVEAQRREAEALRQNIEVRKSSLMYEWDASIGADTERYNRLLAGAKRDLAEIQSRQDTAMQQITLNRATHGYDQAVGSLERLQSLFGSRGCK